ncbi:small ribosomal subunit protein mS31 [Cylas formicarius]|uniref:small ribosomal subunit protein mS31 n=1 Tax=Cylas formicarius TaxID=197179 RepID=UPI0029585980|nr:small ribosomal subunit protein mS31 [Cylas formicarius]
MNLARQFLRNSARSRTPLLRPVTYTETIVKYKGSKIGSTSDGDDSDDDKKPPAIKKVDSSSSSDSTTSDDDIISKKASRSDALSKLNALLKQIVEEDVPKYDSGISLARPVNKRVKVKKEPVDKDIIEAAKEVAASFGGDAKHTESVLMAKLLTPVEGGGALTSKNLGDILQGMKIDREPKPEQESRASQVKRVLESVSAEMLTPRTASSRQTSRRPGLRKTGPPSVREKIDLFEGDGLGIFTDPSKLRDSPQLETLRKCRERDLKLAVTHPPSNYFQEMILWTEQGKLWKFPIDNEYGLDEANTYFADHIFLEKHLEPWCPSKGPIRHFMELVCVGLSKNPHLSVAAKKEYIEWYRDYFEEKRKLLLEVEAIPIESGEKERATDT